MNYQNIIKDLTQQMSVEAQATPQSTEVAVERSTAERDSDTLNMIALEIQRQGGR